MPRLTLVADDLTGAADSAAGFATGGLRTVIPFDGSSPEDAEVVAMSTGSRDLTEAEAVARVRAAVVNAHAAGGSIFKKMDSALRGHVVAEVLAALRGAACDRAIVAPAVPAQGRTTVGGVQRVGDVPLECSAFGQEVVGSNLVAIFAAAGTGYRIRLVDLPTVRQGTWRIESGEIAIVDAETDADLDRIVACLDRPGTLAVGAAGLAAALARAMSPPQHTRRGAPEQSARSVLCIAGTRHTRTAEQIAQVERVGAVVLRPDLAWLEGKAGLDYSPAGKAAHHLLQGRHVIVTTAGMPTCALGGDAVAARLASILDDPELRVAFGGLILTGGDVAEAVCRRLGASAFELHGEVCPAVPHGHLRGGQLPGMPVVTKAGSFGSPETLLASIAWLSEGWGLGAGAR